MKKLLDRDEKFLERQFQQLMEFLPNAMIQQEVARYLEHVHHEGEKELEVEFPKPEEFVLQTGRRIFEPELKKRFGVIGMPLARFLARCMWMYTALRSRFYIFFGGDNRYLKKEREAEINHVRHELIRVWIDALVLLANEDKAPQGSIVLDAYFYPAGKGAESLGGSIPETWNSHFGGTTWRDVFEQSTLQLALNYDAALRIWELFSKEFVRYFELNHSVLSGNLDFIIHIDSETEYVIAKSGKNCFFRWRLKR